MQVEIDAGSGFCFGVVTAIGKAEQAIGSGQRVFSLGDIVHNAEEQHRLEKLGLHTIDHQGIAQVSEGTVLVRAHGEPPSTYQRLNECGVPYIDATCPVVARLQKRVKEAYAKMREVNGQVVILGKRGHAEVVGLTGQVDEPTIVIEGEADLDQVDFSRPIFFLSQTTQSIGLFHRLVEIMRERLQAGATLTVDDTICRRVSNREMALAEFARQFDVVIFVCGRKSSNGKVLFEVCRSANGRSYQVEDECELQDEWFAGCSKVGICGATSTPAWLMEQVANAIRERY